MKEDHSVTIDWERHISSYRRGNQSKAKYCQRHQLELKQFQYHYRRWCERRAKESLPTDFSPVIVQDPVNHAPKAGATTTGVTLQLANGIRCQVHPRFCVTTLKQVLEVLG